jgi:transposase
VRLKYGCKKCEDTVVLAAMPPQTIPKSMAGPGLLSHILVSKFDDHLPLYRQAEMWERSGVHLDRATLGRWVMQCGDLLKPLSDLMQQDIVGSAIIQADETRVQVLNEKGRKNTAQSQMWVFKTNGDKNAKILYHYDPSRSSDVITNILGNFKGYLQSDGFTAYKKFAAHTPKNITNLGCWAHARRKFMDIIKISNKKGIASEVIKKLAELYKIEKDAKTENLSFEQIKDRRQRQSKPILEALKSFLDRNRAAAPPKSNLGRAINYTLKNWRQLIVYLDRGDLEIDNNACERAIRPFAIGRKNWLFKGSVKGAESSAVIYSLIETAKSHGLNPYDYLKDILTTLPIKNAEKKNIKDLLPYNWKSPRI